MSYQVVAIGGTDRTLLESFPSRGEAKGYALEFNNAETEVVNEETGILVGRVDARGAWREGAGARREVLEA